MISILENNGNKDLYMEYIADSTEDLNLIPKRKAGNRVYIINTGEWYILSNHKEWQLINKTIEEEN